MPKYLVSVNYTIEGAKGMHHDGGSKRRDVAQHAIESLGGKLESFYFAYGKSDVICIADFPDSVSATAMAVAVTASGAAETVTTPLITVDEMDKACKKAVAYQPPHA
jgi:uncharacterized protein with GYD domain